MGKEIKSCFSIIWNKNILLQTDLMIRLASLTGAILSQVGMIFQIWKDVSTVD